MVLLDAVLDRVNVSATDGGFPPLVVFGLDGTLFDTRPRTLEILRRFADAIEDSQPDVSETLRALGLHQMHHLVRDTLDACDITDVATRRQISAHWQALEHAEALLSYDEPQAGAADFVREVHRAGAGVVYLTSRSRDSALLATVEQLYDHGFPVGEAGVHLALKPDPAQRDENFKRTCLANLARFGDLVALFDADLFVCEMGRTYYPEATVALLDAWETELPTPQEGVSTIHDFRRG